MKDDVKHTTGPWNWEWDVRTGYPKEPKIFGVYVWNGDDSEPVICDIPDDERFKEGERLANARLISAAPEMLAALVRMVEHIDQVKDDSDLMECRTAMVQAINKATTTQGDELWETKKKQPSFSTPSRPR